MHSKNGATPKKTKPNSKLTLAKPQLRDTQCLVQKMNRHELGEILKQNFCGNKTKTKFKTKTKQINKKTHHQKPLNTHFGIGL